MDWTRTDRSSSISNPAHAPHNAPMHPYYPHTASTLFLYHVYPYLHKLCIQHSYTNALHTSRPPRPRIPFGVPGLVVTRLAVNDPQYMNASKWMPQCPHVNGSRVNSHSDQQGIGQHVQGWRQMMVREWHRMGQRVLAVPAGSLHF